MNIHLKNTNKYHCEACVKDYYMYLNEWLIITSYQTNLKTLSVNPENFEL